MMLPTERAPDGILGGLQHPAVLGGAVAILKKKKKNREKKGKEKIPTAAPILIPDVEQV